MNTYVALCRGINVGGKNALPMKELVILLEEFGCQNVRTYIQSGNVVFESQSKDASQLSNQIRAEIKKRRGFEPHVLVLRVAELEKVIKNNPFPEAEKDPKYLHVGFLASRPQNPDLKKLENLRANNERFRLVGNVFYLHAPAGIGRSRLAANREKFLGVPMTDRNWNTVCKLLEMVKQST